MKKTLLRTPPSLPDANNSRPVSPSRPPSRFGLFPRLLGVLSVLLGIGAIVLLTAHRAQSTGGPVPVQITNAPLATTGADSEAHRPFQTEVSFFQGTGGGFTNSSSFTVPAGSELVIQDVSCQAYAPSSTKALLEITTTAGGTTTQHYAGFLVPSIASNYFALPLNAIHLHADPGTAVSVTVLRESPPSGNIGYYSDITVSGYLVTVP